MAEQTAPAHAMPATGAFCWNELSTTDMAAAKKFYTELLGWTFKQSPAAGMAYDEIVVGGQHIGGIFQTGTEFGNAPSHWMSYVAVDDVDARAKQVEDLGGKVCVPPTDIPNVGRFCVINDPTGATLSLVKLG